VANSQNHRRIATNFAAGCTYRRPDVFLWLAYERGGVWVGAYWINPFPRKF